MESGRRLSLVFIVLIAVLAITSGVEPQSVESVIVDNGSTQVLTPSLDTYIASGSGWADNPRGGSEGLFVGYGDSSAFNLGSTRTLVQFNLAALGAVRIDRVRLRLYLTFTTFEHEGQEMNIEVRQVAEQWNESEATWNSRPSPTATMLDSVNVGTNVDRWVEWDIPPSVVQSWVDNPERNFGLALISPTGETPGKHIRNFTSKEYQGGSRAPQLVVEYTEVTPTPTFTPTPVARLGLFLENDPSTEVAWGDEINYTISFSNTGEINLTGVRIAGRIPQYTNFVSASGAGEFRPTENEVLWTVGELPLEDGRKIDYRVQVYTPTPTFTPTPTASATPTVTLSGVTPMQTPKPTATPTSMPSPTPTVTPPVIVNWAEGYSDQTGPEPVRSNYVINGGMRIYLSLMIER